MSSDSQEITYLIEATANKTQLEARNRLAAHFVNSPIPLNELLFNVGLYTRTSVLAKFILLSDIYKRVVSIPGSIVEFGTWYGQNLVILENLRAIYEPFNKQRRIIGFDTFAGYTDPSDKDKQSDVWAEGSYSTGSEYKDYLEELLKIHESSNILGHNIGNHELVVGDVSQTAPVFFSNNKSQIVAFAYFDMGLYEPTKIALEALIPNLVPGSIILFDELTWSESPGEAIAFKEVFLGSRYEIETCRIFPSKTIVTIK